MPNLFVSLVPITPNLAQPRGQAESYQGAAAQLKNGILTERATQPSLEPRPLKMAFVSACVVP